MCGVSGLSDTGVLKAVFRARRDVGEVVPSSVFIQLPSLYRWCPTTLASSAHVMCVAFVLHLRVLSARVSFADLDWPKWRKESLVSQSSEARGFSELP